MAAIFDLRFIGARTEAHWRQTVRTSVRTTRCFGQSHRKMSDAKRKEEKASLRQKTETIFFQLHNLNASILSLLNCLIQCNALNN